MIKNVIFDMGRVLIEFEPQRYAAHFVSDPGDQRLLIEEVFLSPEWVAMDRGAIGEEEASAAMCLKLPPRLHSVVPELFAYWQHDIPPIEGIADVVRDVQAEGYKLYVLSNVSRRYHEFRDRLPAIDCFDGEFLSCETGLLKPDERFYEAFCKTFGLKAGECFFIDDSPLNIEAARHFGMEGTVFHGSSEKLRKRLKEQGILPA